MGGEVVLILGFANLIADGFSMAASNFLGSRSEYALFHEEKKREHREVEERPEMEREEIREVFLRHGFAKDDTEKLISLVSNNKDFWVDFMMRYELGMDVPEDGEDWKEATLTFFAFVLAGSMPLFPYLFMRDTGDSALYSAIFTGVSLFVVGALRRFVTKRNWFVSGLEMLFVGGVASGVSYLIGYLISMMV